MSDCNCDCQWLVEELEERVAELEARLDLTTAQKSAARSMTRLANTRAAQQAAGMQQGKYGFGNSTPTNPFTHPSYLSNLSNYWGTGNPQDMAAAIKEKMGDDLDE